MFLKYPLRQSGSNFFLMILFITFCLRLKILNCSLCMVFYDWKLFRMSFFAKPNVGMTGVCVCVYIFYINLKIIFEGYKFILKSGQR